MLQVADSNESLLLLEKMNRVRFEKVLPVVHVLFSLAVGITAGWTAGLVYLLLVAPVNLGLTKLGFRWPQRLVAMEVARVGFNTAIPLGLALGFPGQGVFWLIFVMHLFWGSIFYTAGSYLLMGLWFSIVTVGLGVVQGSLLSQSAWPGLLILGTSVIMCVFVREWKDVNRRYLAKGHELTSAWAHMSRVNRSATVGEMVATFAHSINSPLAAIRMGLELAMQARKGRAAEEKVSAVLLRTLKSCDDLALRVRQLTQYANPTKRIPAAVVDLSQVVSEVLFLCQGEALEKKWN